MSQDDSTVNIPVTITQRARDALVSRGTGMMMGCVPDGHGFYTIFVDAEVLKAIEALEPDTDDELNDKSEAILALCRRT